MSKGIATQEAGWYVISAHGSDGTPGIDDVAFVAIRPENTHTQTAFGPFDAEEAARAFVASLHKGGEEAA